VSGSTAPATSRGSRTAAGSNTWGGSISRSRCAASASNWGRSRRRYWRSVA